MNERLERFKHDIKGKEITVVGIGISNTPLIDFLLSCGANVIARDRKTEYDLGDVPDRLRSRGVKVILGANYLDGISGDVIFKTPGMRHDMPQLVEATKRGASITSEMEIFFELCPADIIGVTGSDGKTTTSTIIYNMLKTEGYVTHLGGNIGRPLLSDIEKISPNDKVVLELSSFQLQTMRRSPHIAVITNLSPNHLDMHKDMQEYMNAKKNIYRYQSVNDKLILNYDDEYTRDMASEAKGSVIFFSSVTQPPTGYHFKKNEIYYDDKEYIFQSTIITLPGEHNVSNYMAAMAAVTGLVSKESMKKVAKSFAGVRHRIEFVREVNGVRFYNDSIASSPTRARAGLYSFDQRIILIAGGSDKNIPFDKFGHDIRARAKELVLMGQTSDKIKNAVCVAYEGQAPLPIYQCGTFTEAVLKAVEIAVPGDIVMLSPACASFDMFKNFEERGNRFKQLINDL